MQSVIIVTHPPIDKANDDGEHDSIAKVEWLVPGESAVYATGKDITEALGNLTRWGRP